MRCTQPGCPGTIEDGYCDVCGMPPDSSPDSGVASAPPATTGPFVRSAPAPVGPFATSAPATPSSAVPSVAAPSFPAQPFPAPSFPPPQGPPVVAASGRRSGPPCPQPGCPGRIVDGYCNMCGMPPDVAPAPEPAPPARTSESLEAAVIGSLRAQADRVPLAARRSAAAANRLRAARLGAGLTSVPAAPYVDPLTALMTDPEVPENKRNCPQCGAPVGRSRDGVDGRTDGFCPQCGTRFSFTPKLHPGDLVAGQYEVKGALAHGGMGWIYLAQDRNVSGRFVVLKGLLNSADPDLVDAAIAESRWLAQIQHPLIVEIYNAVQHEGAGYIVMEYVGGKTMKQVLKERLRANNGRYDPLPVDQALALVLEVLPAFQYLHDQGLVYCDFKPDNLVQVGDSVKLIDLGGVRRMDDADSAIFGTVGYQAPEVARQGASVASDIYTIGRTIVVLCAEFRGYQSTYEFSLPTPDDMPLFAQWDSLYRLVLKCCAPEPSDRFASADELRNQLLGVLREVVAERTPGVAQSSAASLLFTPPTLAGTEMEWTQLPQLRGDSMDPQLPFVQQLAGEAPGERLAALAQAPQVSAEIRLARCRAALELGDHELLNDEIHALLNEDPWDWRAVWMSGLGAFGRADWPAAQSAFNAVYGQVPGELAPKLALAFACEQTKEAEVAETLYAICASTDSNFVTPAAFGLARIRRARGELDGALAALDVIPVTSRGYSDSRRLRADYLVALGSGLGDLDVAMTTVHDARLDARTRHRFRVEILTNALAAVRRDGDQPNRRVGETPATDADLRRALEGAYRDLAAATPDRAARAACIDAAHATRKWSLL